MARKWHSFYDAVGSVLKKYGFYLSKNCQRYLVLFLISVFLDRRDNARAIASICR